MDEPRHLPPSLLAHKGGASFALAGPDMLGGKGGGVPGQAVNAAGGGYWRAVVDQVSVHGPTKTGGSRADKTARQRAFIQAGLLSDGMAGLWYVPYAVLGNRLAPWPTGAPSGPILTTHSDGTPHSDDTPYAQDVISAVVHEAASLRATRLKIRMLVGADLLGAEAFSVWHGAPWRHRLYMVAAINDRSGSVWDVTIRPPLRAPIAAGAEITFDRPLCTMQSANVEMWDTLFDMHGVANPSLTFIEWWPMGGDA